MGMTLSNKKRLGQAVHRLGSVVRLRHAAIEAPAEIGREGRGPSGRGKPGRPLRAWLNELLPDQNAALNLAGLPLFDWAIDRDDRGSRIGEDDEGGTGGVDHA